MVAKATQNLFDVNIGGAGFHFTSHLIALVALFIACFAITGYISYRGNSIPASAVKDESDSLTKRGETWRFEKEFELNTLAQTNANDVVAKTGLVLPSNALLVNSTILVTTGGTVTTADGALLRLVLSSLGLPVGDPGGVIHITDSTDLDPAGLAARGTLGGFDSTNAILPSQREVYFTTETGTFAQATDATKPKVVVTIEWIGSPPVRY